MINIFGSPTSGKSTIVELLQSHIERLYTVDFDVVKHQISNYTWSRDSIVAQDITYDTLASASKTGLPIAVLLPKPKEQEDYERIEIIANDNGYKLLNVELSAPEEVLIARYQDRLSKIEDSELVRRMKNLDEFKVYIRTPYFRPINTVTFDSSVQKPNEIFSAITEQIDQTG